MNIVLAHGYLGYGEDTVRYKAAPYFRDVAPHLRSLGHAVFQPTVPATGSIEARSLELARQLRMHFPDASPLHVIAHSMGGLDTRRVLERDDDLHRRIKSLVCIATPHLGSPVASALNTPIPLAGVLGLPTPAGLASAVKLDRGALADLAEHATLQAPDVKDVRYVDIACDGRQIPIGSPLFVLVRAIGGIGNQVVNDGVVLQTSAQVRKPASAPIQHELWPMWPVDHGGAIGWATNWPDFSLPSAPPPPGHLQRYENIVARLISGQ